MSRTYRNVSHTQIACLYYDWVWDSESGTHYKVGVVPTKKDIALTHRDGGNWDASRGAWHFNQMNKARRRNDKNQLRKFYFTADYEEEVFDPSKAEMARKGVWWDIY